MMDNYEMWERHDAEQERQLQKLPKCILCGEPIQQDFAVHLFGGYICDTCLEDARREVL